MDWNQKMTRRELFKRAGQFSMAGALLYLAACAPKSSGNNLGGASDSLDDEFTGRLSLLLNSEMTYIAALAPAYQSQHGVNPAIEYVTTTDLKNKLTSAFVARQSQWDSVFVTAEIGAELADKGWLVDLDAKAASIVNGSRPILEGAFGAGQFSGKTYAIPVTTGCPVMLWNKKMMADAGLDPEAPANWHSTPGSWDTMVEYAKAMTGSRNGTEHYGLVDAWAGPHVLWMYGSLIQMHGGDLLDLDNQPVMNSEAGIEALQKMVDLLHTHKCIDPGSVTYTWVFDASPGFLAGTRGIFTTWPFMAGVAEGDDSAIKGHVGVAPNPSVKTSASVDGSEFLSIPVYAKNQAEAWRFIELVTSYENQRKQGIETPWLPIYSELLDDPEVLKTNPTASVVKQAYQYPTKGYRSADYSQWTNILSEEVHQALNRSKSPKDALNDAVNKINSSRSA
ncbi:extracellular solute-binding protein [Paenibacillaceae bacterium WGS1546]|uniref:extracellular solute-binding protein n=1 Tax=Cohnella sp. WGS1546 TaxID=3366810 RepID=UPI00372D2C2F